MGQTSTPKPSDTGRFIWEFLKAPHQTASLVPSSAALAAEMIVPVPEQGDPVVVELGPGSGVFTAAIQHRLAGRGRHLAIELNPRWAKLLGSRYPGVDVACEDAARLPELLAQRELSTVDVVVSGLPWAAFPPSAAQPLVRSVASVLSDSGVFTQFTYAWTRWMRPARRQVAQLNELFEEVVISRTVWANFPPALVYQARRPRR